LPNSPISQTHQTIFGDPEDSARTQILRQLNIHLIGETKTKQNKNKTKTK
jgi:hypothetical protein